MAYALKTLKVDANSKTRSGVRSGVSEDESVLPEYDTWAEEVDKGEEGEEEAFEATQLT